MEQTRDNSGRDFSNKAVLIMLLLVIVVTLLNLFLFLTTFETVTNVKPEVVTAAPVSAPPEPVQGVVSLQIISREDLSP